MHQKQVKSVLNKQKQRDSWFLTEYSVNAYEGCSCNCLYCYVRGSKYGENMDNGLAVKSNVLEVLEKQLIEKRSRVISYTLNILGGGKVKNYGIKSEEKYLRDKVRDFAHKAAKFGNFAERGF